MGPFFPLSVSKFSVMSIIPNIWNEQEFKGGHGKSEGSSHTALQIIQHRISQLRGENEQHFTGLTLYDRQEQELDSKLPKLAAFMWASTSVFAPIHSLAGFYLSKWRHFHL